MNPKDTTFARSPSTAKSRRGFTLIELLTVIAIIGILAAILVPVVGSVRATVDKATCSSRLREIYNGYRMYAAEHGDRVVPPFRFQNYAQYGINPGENLETYLNCIFHWFMTLVWSGYMGMPDLPHATFEIQKVNSSGTPRYENNAVKCYHVFGCPTV